MGRFASTDADISFHECHEKAVILAVLQRAILDYLYPRTIKSSGVHTKQDDVRLSAESFLFADDYMIDWGDHALTVKELLDFVDLDINRIRNIVIKKSKSLDTKPNMMGILTIQGEK